MAVFYSGWSNAASYTSPAVRLKIESSISQSTQGNYSTVLIKEYIETSGYDGTYDSSTDDHVLTHTGTTVYKYDSFGHMGVYGGTQTTLIQQYSKKIYHNSEGKAFYSVSGSCHYDTFNNGNGWASGTISIAKQTISLPDIAPTITTFNVSNIKKNSVDVTWGANKSCDAIQYRWNGGNWADAVGYPTFTITGLSYNTTYFLEIRAKGTTTQLWSSASGKSIKTLDIARITNLNVDLNVDSGITVTFNKNGAEIVDVYVETIAPSVVTRTTRTEATSPYLLELTADEKQALYEHSPNSNSFQIRIGVRTDMSAWDSKDGIATISDANPTFNNFAYQDVNPITLDLTGSSQKIIKGYSNVKAIVSTANKAVAIKGATMSKYRFVCGEKQIDVDYSDSTTVELLLNAIDNNVFMVYAIDSRGNSTMKQISPSTYFAYTKPTLNPIVVSRLTQADTHTKLSFSGSFFNVNFGSKSNTLIATYYFAESNSEEWITGTTPLTITKNGNNYSLEGEIAGDLEALGFSLDNSYILEVYIDDKLSEVYDDEILSSGKPNIAWHKNGNAFKMPFDETIGESEQFGAPMYELVNETLKKVLNTNDIIDTFVSTSTEDVLSANKGKELNDRLIIVEDRGYGIYNNYITTPFTTTSISYVNVTGVSCSINTNGGKVKIRANGTLSVSNRTSFVGVLVNGVDYDIFSTNSTTADSSTGVVVITNLPKGTYTIQLRLKVQNSADTGTIASYRTISIEAQEI